MVNPKKRKAPPRLAEALVRRLFPDGGFDTRTADMKEEFEGMVLRRGVFRAGIWYRFQGVLAMYHYLSNQLRGGGAVFKHHLKMTLRHLSRHKVYSFINIFGLAVSFTVVIFIALFIKNEKSFNRCNVNLDRMYVVMMGENEEACQTSIISAAGLELDENIPEILEFTRFNTRFDYALQSTEMDRGLKRAVLLSGPKFAWTDPGMFRIFTYKALAGDLNTALDDPYSIVLTEAVADKLFGSQDPLGQVVRLNNRYDLKVTGVVETPQNSHIDYDVFGSVATLRAVSGQNADRDYQYNSFPTYVLLPQDHDPAVVSRKINDHMAAVFKRVGREIDNFFLYPVRNLYLSPVQYTRVHGSTSLLWILFTIAVFILLIAGINFINLSTARASVRAGEIGIKKVVGVMRKNLIRQFLGESVFVALLALAAAFVLVMFVLPSFNRSFGMGVTLQSLFEPLTLLGIGMGVCLIGILAGLYPALFLSAFPPVSVLRGEVTRGRKGAFFRKALIVFQFAVSVVLLSGTFIVLNQIRFVRSKDLGFRSENVLVFPEPSLESFQNIRETVKAELLRHPDIQVISVSHGYPGRPWNNESLKIGEEYVGFTHYSADSDFADVYELELLEGRFIDHTRPGDFQRAVVLNETAVREFGLKNPVGTHIPYKTRGNLTAFPVEEIEVVGVVKDFHCRSLHDAINPVMISWNPDWLSWWGLKYSGTNLSGVVTYAKEVWSRFAPGFPFDFLFLDDYIKGMYSREAVFETIFFSAAGFSILIACLGLLGLSGFVAEKRTKEIGIRKILGASAGKILVLLSGEFAWAVLAANVIAWPAAYFFMNRWLENFAYRIEIGLGTFIIAAAAALFIALFTVGWQSIRAATAEPVNSLRFE